MSSTSTELLGLMAPIIRSDSALYKEIKKTDKPNVLSGILKELFDMYKDMTLSKIYDAVMDNEHENIQRFSRAIDILLYLRIPLSIYMKNKLILYLLEYVFVDDLDAYVDLPVELRPILWLYDKSTYNRLFNNNTVFTGKFPKPNPFTASMAVYRVAVEKSDNFRIRRLSDSVRSLSCFMYAMSLGYKYDIEYKVVNDSVFATDSVSVYNYLVDTNIYTEKDYETLNAILKYDAFKCLIVYNKISTSIMLQSDIEYMIQHNKNKCLELLRPSITMDDDMEDLVLAYGNVDTMSVMMDDSVIRPRFLSSITTTQNITGLKYLVKRRYPLNSDGLIALFRTNDMSIIKQGIYDTNADFDNKVFAEYISEYDLKVVEYVDIKYYDVWDTDVMSAILMCKRYDMLDLLFRINTDTLEWCIANRLAYLNDVNLTDILAKYGYNTK